MFKNVTHLALKKLEDPEIARRATSQTDLIIFIDRIAPDYAFLHYQIMSEEFKATITKYDLLNDAFLKNEVEEIVNTIEKLSNRFVEEQGNDT